MSGGQGVGTVLTAEAGAPVVLCFLGADDAAVDFPLALSLTSS